LNAWLKELTSAYPNSHAIFGDLQITLGKITLCERYPCLIQYFRKRNALIAKLA
jgi:hypothetical protein